MTFTAVTLICSAGHTIVAPARFYDACPVYTRGAPCPGQLTATGPGARAENARLSTIHERTTP